MTSKDFKPPSEAKKAEVDTFLKKAEVDAFLRKAGEVPVRPEADGGGRLVFALDATASREPTWDRACQLQGEMFQATASLGGLAVQLCYYRGFGEFKASKWLTNWADLVRSMTSVFCLGGQTQIAKVLRHAIAETKRRRINALVFVGDCMEEDVDHLCGLAGELGLLGVPAFMFHEGGEPVAARVFRHIARLTKGAYCTFDSSSAKQLRDLLSAAAVYAAGGHAALESYSQGSGSEVKLLASQLKSS